MQTFVNLSCAALIFLFQVILLLLLLLPNLGFVNYTRVRRMVQQLGIIVVLTCLFSLLNYGVESSGGLSYNFYEKTCPQVENIIRDGLKPVFSSDITSPAALLRLMFHDCQVQGCDASILVDQDSQKNDSSEMASTKNFAIRQRETISLLKSMVEVACPNQVSCADILIMAAREAVATSGGPRIEVPLGCRDSSSTPSYELANALLPPSTIGVEELLQIFVNKGMSVEESVAIMGSHTLGVTHCLNIKNRLYEGEEGPITGMEHGFEAFLRLSCPNNEESMMSKSRFVLNDPTALGFDNLYYINAMSGHGLLRIDAEMVMDSRTTNFVRRFGSDQEAFFQAFASAFVKLSSYGVLVGKNGVIRKRCDVVD
ncbi:peroxidase 29 [Cannabis sativa]|uniref:peroxidase 29 n=1 Tax=Cannabis sativa TaxID=3483 RepID=UPI0029CA10A4|nr:peroxidase 29 [Cannabis sativa]